MVVEAAPEGGDALITKLFTSVLCGYPLAGTEPSSLEFVAVPALVANAAVVASTARVAVAELPEHARALVASTALVALEAVPVRLPVTSPVSGPLNPTAEVTNPAGSIVTVTFSTQRLVMLFQLEV
jgi:hypothetical protein